VNNNLVSREQGALQKKYQRTPVIAMTGWGDHPDALAREANADRLLLKPFGI